MDFKELLKKYWFVVIVAIALVAFIGVYATDSIKNREKIVKSKQVDGKYVVYSIDGVDVFADDFFDTLYSQKNGMTNTFKQFERKVVNEAYKTDNELADLASAYASGAYQYYGEDYISNILKNSGYTGGVEALQDYYLDMLKAEMLFTDYLKLDTSIFNSYVELEAPRMVKHILIMVKDITSTDENGETIYTANPSEEEQAKLNSVLEALKTKDFEEVQEEFNEDSANDAFYLTSSNSSQYYPIFSKTGLALNDNEVSEVVTSKAGYHIIKNMGSDIDTLINSEDFLAGIQNVYPTSYLQAILKKADELGFKIVDEGFQNMIDLQLESEVSE